MANFSEIERLMKLRRDAYKRQALNLKRLSSSLDADIYKFVRDKILPSYSYDSSNRLLSSSTNINASRNIKQLSQFLKGKIDPKLNQFYIGSAKGNAKGAGKYFSIFKPSKAIRSSVNKTGNAALKTLLVSIFTQSNVQVEIETTIARAVMGGAKEKEAISALKDVITGKEKAGGLTQQYHYQRGQDALRAHGSLLDNKFSQALDLNYAIYTGSEKKTTRAFCEQRVGNVYTREEIESWEDLDWSGKKTGHNIILDRGGWNCGHQYAWVSYQLARRLREDIPKSEFDNK